jgi:hypothetical protein
MPRPERLALDVDDLTDLPIFVHEWIEAAKRSLDRATESGLWTDALFALEAVSQLEALCATYAEHDASGRISEWVQAFKAENASARGVPNAVTHLHQYYRGVGNNQADQRHRIFPLGVARKDDELILHTTSLTPQTGSCNVTRAVRGVVELAERVLAAPEPTQAWLDGLLSN